MLGSAAAEPCLRPSKFPSFSSPMPSMALQLRPFSPHLPKFPLHDTTKLCFSTPTIPSLHHRFNPARLALESDAPRPIHQKDKAQADWDSWTAKFAGASNIPFLFIQLPQILLNAQNLMEGNRAALFAIPWLSMLTGLLGNLTLLSYFAKKKESEAILVQTLGVVSIYIVLVQLAMAGAMPLPHFTAASVVVASGLVLNFINYFGWLNATIWLFWEDFITIGGLSVLPQVMWSTFVPYIPSSILPGMIAGIVAIAAVIMARTGRLSAKGVKFVRSISGWTATLLFMWMPIAQMWTNLLNPENIKGLSAFTMLLAMIGNGLMIPRALFVRDLMWFTGTSWASFLYGWGNLMFMYCFNSISREFFLAATIGLYTWTGIALWRDSKVYGYTSPMTSLKSLFLGPGFA